jgi:hypothetical protein
MKNLKLFSKISNLGNLLKIFIQRVKSNTQCLFLNISLIILSIFDNFFIIITIGETIKMIITA